MSNSLSNFMKRNILSEPVYYDIGMFGNKRRFTKKQLQLLKIHGRPLPLTKAEKLIRVEHDIREALNNIQYHERCMKAYGTELAILTQKQKTLETTR